MVVALAAVIVNIAMVAGLVWQTRLDHNRRRKQATIDHWTNDTRVRYLALRDLVEDRRPKGSPAVSDDELVELATGDDADADMQHAVRDYLNSIEWLAVGVNTDVFDKTIVQRLAARRLVDTWDGFDGYIHARRDELQQESLYEEFETLAGALRTVTSRK